MQYQNAPYDFDLGDTSVHYEPILTDFSIGIFS